MPDPPPFILTERADGRHELRAFSDDSEVPIILILDRDDGRQFGVAVADILTALDAGIERSPIEVSIDGRRLTIEGTPEKGLRITVAS